MDKGSKAMKTKYNRVPIHALFILSALYITTPALGAEIKYLEKCTSESGSILTPVEMISSIFSKQDDQRCADAQKKLSRYIREDGEYFNNISSDKIFRKDIPSTAVTENAEGIGGSPSIISKKFVNTIGREIGSESDDALPTARGFKTILPK